MTNTEMMTNGAADAAAKPQPTRRDQLRRMLARKSGATIPQMQKVFGWQPHTARAALSGLRKAGTLIERSETGKGSVYRIAKAEKVQ